MVEALLSLVGLFRENRIEYCLVGGLAMMLHHGRANTVDIDFYALVNDLNSLLKIFKKKGIPAELKGKFQVKAKVMNVPIDILLADHYLGKEVVHRAVDKKLGKTFIRVATPEDLIILKTLADRSIDRRDIEELRELFGKKLDEAYISKKLKGLRRKIQKGVAS